MKDKIIRDTGKEFDEGYQVALNLIDDLAKISKGNPSSNHMAGAISCILNFSYVFSPSEEAVGALIEFCKDFAIKESKEFKKSDAYHTGEVKSKFVQH
tara:strand:+ start:182 stop:475 length:294 start_codon:yes stop_codon:yes gene_type:complete